MKKIILFSLLVLSGCGGGDEGVSDNDTSDGLTGGWVTIDDPTDHSSTFCETENLSGEAFIASEQCCVDPIDDIGNVSVSWENLVSGEKGTASQSVWYCRFAWGIPWPCEHDWFATVPLVLGDNVIKVTAVDPNGRGGTKTITVFKSEYSYTVSGTLSTHEDITFGYTQSDIELLLTDGIDRKIIRTPWNTDGKFKFSCIPNGSYTLEPVTSSFNYVFNPEFYSVSVADQDVVDQHFKTEAYTVSGFIYNAPGSYRSGGIPEIQITISNADTSWSRMTDKNKYSIVVPSGTYTLKPSNAYEGCTWIPASRNVVITNSSLPDQNFARYCPPP